MDPEEKDSKKYVERVAIVESLGRFNATLISCKYFSRPKGGIDELLDYIVEEFDDIFKKYLKVE